MTNRRNYYRLLQVQPEAPVEVIRSSFRALMRECKQHPDLGGNHLHAALLNEAYETLSDPDRRAEYDRKLRKPTSGMRVEKNHHETPKPKPAAAESEKSVAGRRSFERMGRNITIHYATGSNAGAAGEMVDFSPEGMLFLCRENLPLNSTIQVTSALLQATARVSQCRATATAGMYSVGLKFVRVMFENSSGTFISSRG